MNRQLREDLSRSGPRNACAAGFTILELLATLSVLLVLAVTASGILSNVRSIGATRQSASEHRAAVIRFADVFRDDIAAARAVDLNDGKWPLRASTDESVIEYRWNGEDSVLTRAFWEVGPDQFDPKVAPNARETFVLGDRCSPRVEIEGSLVRIVLREQTGPLAAWVVEAVR